MSNSGVNRNCCRGLVELEGVVYNVNTLRRTSLMTISLTPRVNLWLERDGNVVLSLWRVRLLEALAETGSISGAADRKSGV